jgi:predicted adenylyl cyclase CyaB
VAPGPIHTNLELKARVASLNDAAAIALACGARYEGFLIQRDTYFRVRAGRLKIRETEGAGAELICYLRDDVAGARVSRYTRDRIQNAELLNGILHESLGILTIVDKKRELFLYRNARIHIDNVRGLGSFVEFEIMEGDPEESETLMQFLCQAFRIREADIVQGSYSDMISAETQGNST